MKQDKITSLQYATLSFFLINSFLMNIGFSFLTNISNTDAIIDLLLGGIGILAISYFVFKIHHIKKLNIIDLIDNNYSKIVRLFLFIILIIIVGISSIYSLSILVSFIHNYILKEVSIFIITVTMAVTILYIVSKGLPTISKISEMFFYIYILIFLIGTFGLIKYIDLENLKPLFTANIKEHFTCSSIYLISSIIPLFLLLVIPQNKINWTQKNKPYPFIFIGISIILNFIEIIIIISVLGIRLTNIYKTPDIIAFKKISFLNLLERMEVFLSLNNILNSLFFIIMSIYFIKELFNHVIKKKKEHIILALIGIIIILLSSLIKWTAFIYININIISIIILLLLGVHFVFHKYIH